MNDKTVFDFTVTDADGNPYPLEQHRGSVLLIVNVASKCGFTPQYTGLQHLHQQFQTQGLVLLGFPCNQFGGQEPGTDTEIQSFCSERFQVTFPILAKIKVNGDAADPLFRFLCQQQKGLLGSTKIKWNFTKFLINRSGEVVERYGSRTVPAKLADATAALL